MRNIVLFAFVVLNVFNAFGDIGVVKLRIYQESINGIETISFYTIKDSLSKKIKIDLFFSNHGGIQLTKSFDSLGIQGMSFNPMSFINKGDWVTIYFRCVNKFDNWVEVVIDENTGKTLWLYSKNNLKLYDWNKFLKKNAVALSVITTDSLVLKKAPDKLSESIVYKNRNCFLGKKIKGDWLFVNSNGEFCYKDGAQSPNAKAWLKFKENDKMLIKIMEIYEED
ncbi:MAG: hypothetical protein A3F72_01760 [Bacteroidetes bacterium RIFCSPLOWO2_12_FULL_35_15]|nr:MAG: hypothetical protein A3F72_01760 [Bacteroidetes bacterium RIFCSPLOWO2_12_FULL_35_15]